MTLSSNETLHSHLRCGICNFCHFRYGSQRAVCIDCVQTIKSESLQIPKDHCVQIPVKNEKLHCMSFLFLKNCNYWQFECIYYLNKHLLIPIKPKRTLVHCIVKTE